MKVLPLSLLRIFLTQVVLTLVLSLTIGEANAQRHGGGNGAGRGGNGPHGPSQLGNPNGDFLSLNKYMYNGEKINLSQSLNLQGVSSLVIQAQATGHRSKLEIKLNRQTIQTISLSQYSSPQTVMLPMMSMNQRLILEVSGSAFVENIQAIKNIGPGPGPGGQDRLVALMHGQLTQSTTLQVRKLIAQQNGQGVLMGKNLDKVVLVASSARGRAQATLLINGMPVGYSQTIPTHKQRLVFNLQGRRNIIGQKVKSVEIQIQGRAVTLNRVATIFKQGGGHHGGGYNRSVRVNVNQNFFGSQLVKLTQLIANPRINMNAPVKKLIIDVAGHGNVMINGAGMRLGSIIAGGGYGSLGESVHVNGAASANDIMMRISGRVTIKSITVELGY
jgi:hypothetical protein